MKFTKVLLIALIILFAFVQVAAGQGVEPKYIPAGLTVDGWTGFGVNVYENSIQFAGHVTQVAPGEAEKLGPCSQLDTWLKQSDYIYAEQAVFQFDSQTNYAMQVTVLQGQDTYDYYDYVALADDIYDQCVRGEPNYANTSTNTTKDFFNFDENLGVISVMALEQDEEHLAVSALVYAADYDLTLWVVAYIDVADIKADSSLYPAALLGFYSAKNQVLEYMFNDAL